MATPFPAVEIENGDKPASPPGVLPSPGELNTSIFTTSSSSTPSTNLKISVQWISGTSVSDAKDVLRDDDHFAVKSALISVASRWKHIGSALGLHQDVLNTIQQTFGTDYSEAVSQIVSKWLAQSYNVEKFGRPSWDRLVEAVAHEAGGADRHKADEIARIHSTSGEMDKQEESLSPSGPTKVYTGLITVAFADSEMMGEHSSYHQSIPGAEAIRRLKGSGHPCCYLTRYSESQKSYILTVYRKQSPKDEERHFKIVIEHNRQHRIEGQTASFSDIGQLLTYYETHRIHPSLKNIGHNYTEDDYNTHLQNILSFMQAVTEAQHRPTELHPPERSREEAQDDVTATEDRPPRPGNEDATRLSDRPADSGGTLGGSSNTAQVQENTPPVEENTTTANNRTLPEENTQNRPRKRCIFL